jgi:hypothetical protein
VPARRASSVVVQPSTAARSTAARTSPSSRARAVVGPHQATEGGQRTRATGGEIRQPGCGARRAIQPPDLRGQPGLRRVQDRVDALVQPEGGLRRGEQVREIGGVRGDREQPGAHRPDEAGAMQVGGDLPAPLAEDALPVSGLQRLRAVDQFP